jgi:hypothetical protein
LNGGVDLKWSGGLLVNTVKNAVKLLGAFRPDVEKIQYH